MAALVTLELNSVFAGDFRVDKPLSEGGMGAVYVVEQLSTGKRRALKIMAPQLVGDESMRQRFVMEAKIGARIESDHVVEVVSAGIDAATGTPWLAMELLNGETLADRVEKEGPMPQAEVAEVVSQLCHALGAAHDVGIVHRDLKPENVFLAVPRREGVPFMLKVLDFGIAKLVADAGTRTTGAIGSPLWMAPEQANSAGAIKPSTDVWALGLLVFWMLTGMEYWRSAHGEDRNAMQLLMEAATLPIDPASVRANELHRGHLLPPGFDAWFAKCVVRDMNARFRDAWEARTALERGLSTLRPPAPQPSHTQVQVQPQAVGTSASATTVTKGLSGSMPAVVPDIAPTPPAVSAGDVPDLDLPAPPVSKPPAPKPKPAPAPVLEIAAAPVASGPVAPPPAAPPVAMPPPNRTESSGRHRAVLDVARPSGTMRAISRAQVAPPPERSIPWVKIGIGGVLVLAFLFGLQRFFLSRASTPSPSASATKPSDPTAPASSTAALANNKCLSGMVYIPGGTYVSQDKISTVADAMCKDVTEVRVRDYNACVRKGKCTAAHTSAKWPSWSGDASAVAAAACNGGRTDREEHPINCVDWTQANAYCTEQMKKLPTDEQWEWAARAGSKRTKYPWGDDPPHVQLCWSNFSKRAGTCEVGTHKSGDNPWGVHDLEGNLKEWTGSSIGDDRLLCGTDWTDRRETMGGVLGACGRAQKATYSPFVGFRCITTP